MTFDMSQFLVTFYEESFEGLEVMEAELLSLDIGAADLETINTIFRAAHSIKGGSGTFGLNDVANFTHVMETLLDEMRDGKRDVTQDIVNILLESVDILFEMLTVLKAEEELDVEKIATVKAKLDAFLATADTAAVAPVVQSIDKNISSTASESGWLITFKPDVTMLQTGNDPVRMFRELSGLGEYSVQVEESLIPDFLLMEPENSYLAWTITLKGQIEKQAVKEVFDWVDDECDLQISEIDPATSVDIEVATTETVNESVKESPELDIELLETTFAVIAPQGDILAERFYIELFKRYPQVKPLFANTDIKKQQIKLLSALKFVVANLRNPEALTKTLSEMGERHQKYGALPEHYEAVKYTLLDVMKDLAGDVWNKEVDLAWKAALDTVSNVMIAAYKTDNVKKVVQEEKSKLKVAESSSIRVSIEKVDELINMVGELVITQSMLNQLGDRDKFDDNDIENLKSGLMQLERNTRELQENVMRIRMLPISFVFQRFPRLVHDLSSKLGKKIELKLTGESTELDKTVMEKIGDPLVHLVRNSLDHGIETPDKRVAAGKNETGIISLKAFHQGGNIIIEITDDGAGLNIPRIKEKAISSGIISQDDRLSEEQIANLIFLPGFSTAEVVSDVSGRGVGMDVVKRNIRSLGGTVTVATEAGVGSTFTIRLPLTLAILDGQSIVVGTERYIIPLVSIVESTQIDKDKISGVPGEAEVYRLREEYIPIIKLYELFDVKPEHDNLEDGLLVIVESEGVKIALLVDDLLGQQQVVIKSLETNFKKVEGVSGATILGDGTVALILDVGGLIDMSKEIKRKQKIIHSLKMQKIKDNSVAA